MLACPTDEESIQTLEAPDRMNDAPHTGTDCPLLLFDGVCGLCNWYVDFVMKRDYKKSFQFAPLQGETARKLLGEEETTNLKTVVLVTGGESFRYSSAIVRIFWLLGGIWAAAGWLIWLIPKPLRDLGYRIVATNRYRWFGHREQCRMPTAADRERILP